MPYIDVSVNVPVSGEAAGRLKAAFGDAIALIPGKSESHLMVGIARKEMYYGGSDAPCAFLKLQIYGKADVSGFAACSDACAAALTAELGIPASRVYVNFEEHPHWYVGGTTI